jgi:hypothetical protein
MDVAQDRTSDEICAAALSAFPTLVQLNYAVSRRWRHRGKWIIKKDGDDGLMRSLVAAYRELLANGDKNPWLEIAGTILDLAGGPCCLGKGNELILIDTDETQASTI